MSRRHSPITVIVLITQKSIKHNTVAPMVRTVTATIKKNVNRYSHITSSPITQSRFFEKVRFLILASTQRKRREYIEFLKFDVTIKKIQIRIKFEGLE